jgi:N-acetylglucosamine kinase-like BadF-type ATPase
MGFRMADGRTPPTGLVRILKSRFGVRRFDEILDMVYSNRISVEEIAGLAPYVSKEASHDKVCRQILREAGASLAELACTAARRLNMRGRAFPVATVGGGFRSGRYLVEPFTSSVKQEYPQVRFLTLKDEPAKGAYRIAAQLSHHGSKAFSRDDRWLRKVVY